MAEGTISTSHNGSHVEAKPMPVEHKDTPSAAEAGPEIPAEGTIVRKLDHPYFELRSPDAQTNSYLEGNAYKMLTASQEKLHVFLPEARLVMDQSTTPRKRSVHFLLDPKNYKNVRPMDALPPSEFAAFEEAAKDFYDKAAPNRKDVHPYETFLRLNFRLPDPEREPEAYLVYGEEFERRLLILWGCEKEKDSALPLIKHPVVHWRKGGGETVVDKLRRKTIGWEQMQKDTLLLLAKTREPLLRFLGQPVYDEKGEFKGVKIGEVALPAAKTRPLRYLLPPEMKQFYKACQEFYARAASAKSPYEKELRKNFQLPDPVTTPEAFLVHGPFNKPRLIILLDGKFSRDHSLWLTPAPDLNIPPMPPITPEQELLGHKPVPPPTLTDKLQSRTIPFAKIFSVAGTIIATPLLLAFLVWLALDKSPPHPVNIVPGTEANSILVRFNEAIDPASLPKAAAFISKAFVLMQSNEGPVTISSAMLNTTGQYKNREIKLSTPNPFIDGTGYRLAVNSLADRAMLHNEMTKAVHVGFIYEDDKPPVLGTPSGDGESLSHLVLPFNKLMDPGSIAETGNYSIDGSNFKVTGAALDEDKKSVILTVSPDMPLKSEHTLVVRNVKDSTKRGNRLNPDPFTVDFRFVDTLPPKLRKVAAVEQNKVVLDFNEKLNASTITNLTNYTLAAHKDGHKLEVYFAQLLSPKQIAIFTTPLYKDNDYDLTVEKIGDVAEPPNFMTAPEHRSFSLPPELENHFLPHIETLSHQPDRTKILVDFGVTNRLRPDLVLTRKDFKLKMLVNDHEMDFTPTIMSISDPAVADYPPGLERISLLLSTPLEKGQTYRVSVRNLQDIWGHTNSVSDQALNVKGFYVDLAQRGIKFQDAARRNIHLALNWQIDNSSIIPDNFKIAGHRVVEVTRGENDYTLILHLDAPITSDRFTISCKSLRMAGSHLESPPKDFDGPDREK